MGLGRPFAPLGPTCSVQALSRTPLWRAGFLLQRLAVSAPVHVIGIFFSPNSVPPFPVKADRCAGRSLEVRLLASRQRSRGSDTSSRARLVRSESFGSSVSGIA